MSTPTDQVVLDLATDWRVIGFAAAPAALTCLLFGLVPALRATRVGAETVMKGVRPTEYRIIGIVADSKYQSLREEPAPVAYLPMSQEPRSGRWALVAVRGRLEPTAMTTSIVAALRELDPTIGVSFTMLDTFIDQTLVRERLMAALSSFFGSIAAALAMIGLYGVIAYTVARRTNEIGVRMALGATRGNVISMVLREAGVVVGVGMSVGLLLALLSGRFAQTLLFGLEPRDPLSIGIAVVTLGTVALLASYLPARTASRIEPTLALRIE